MSAYDQTKGELCDKCGWAMKFFGEPCRCELERENAALRVQVEELDAKWKMAEAHCFDQVGKIGELKRENATLADALASAEVGLKHALMMEPGDPFKRVKAITAALDSVRAARKEAHP